MSEATLNCSYFLASFLNFDLYLVVVGVLMSVLVLTVIKWRRKLHPIAFVSMLLIFAGGSYNVYQRITTGCVIDGIDFFGLFKFNIADFLITVGLVTLAGNILMYNDKRRVVVD